MKVLFLVSSLRSGGAERVASELVNAWAERGHNVTLVPTYSGGGESAYVLDSRVKLIFLASELGGAAARGKNYFQRLMALRRLLGLISPDVVVSFLPNVNLAALVITRFSGVPCIISERADPSMVPIGRHWKLGCRLLYRFADLVVVQTQAVATTIRRLYPGLNRVAVIPNPIAQGVRQWVKPRQRASGRKSMLVLGRLVPEKNVDRIVSAFSALANDHRDWDLVVHGDGPLRAELQAQISASGLNERVRLLGWTAEPWRVMADCDAFVMASRYEGFPNALVEAMAVGLPCVSTDCPSGPREISGDGRYALLVPPDNLNALTEAMARLMTDESLRVRLGQEGQAAVRSRYALPSVLAQWDAAFAAVGVRP